MRGLIVNLSTQKVEAVDRDGPAAVTLDGGVPVFEVWNWHQELRRWFVMAATPDPNLQAQGVVYYRPDQVHNLPRALVHLGRQQGLL